MTPAAIQAMKDRAAALFTGAPLYWPNEEIPEQGNPEPYIWSEVVGLDATIRAMAAPGQHWVQDAGFIRFHVVVPAGEGTDNVYALANTLAGVFRIQNFAGVQTFAPTPPDRGVKDGTWFTVSFSVPYTFDYQG